MASVPPLTTTSPSDNLRVDEEIKQILAVLNTKNCGATFSFEVTSGASHAVSSCPSSPPLTLPHLAQSQYTGHWCVGGEGGRGT